MENSTVFIHPSAVVDVGASIGAYSSIWHFSHLEREAVVGENCNLGQNTYIGNQAIIGNGCRLKNSIVGPHVSVGPNTTLEYSVVRDSIIGSYTNLFEVVLDNSLIGSDASVKGLSRTLNIGDNTELDFG